MRSFLRDNGLSITLLLLFAVFFAGQAETGRREYNEERRVHGEAPVELSQYLRTGHFLEATAENWESEFLQMAAYVLLTIRLFQRGSSESKDPDNVRPERPKKSPDPRAPGPVRRGGWILRVYEHSLSIAFVLLFIGSIALHAFGGVLDYNEQRMSHGEAAVSMGEYLATSTFWFESFQNWQSEFLALASMVILSIFLRQRGSPESKPVDAPHARTGGD